VILFSAGNTAKIVIEKLLCDLGVLCGKNGDFCYQVMITVNGKKVPWREGMTVADLLKDLNDSYTYILVRINDKQVSRPNFDKTLIPDNSEVFLVPMVAGG